MLKAKTGNNSHKSRTVDGAIKEVQKQEEVMINNKIPKDLHTKFKIKAAQEGTTMKDVLIEYITLYVDK